MSGVNNDGPLAVVGSATSWSATGTVSTTGSLAPTFTIDFSDITGNTGSTVTGSTDGSSVSFDSTAPTVVLSSAAPSTISGAISVIATFSEVMTGFTLGDITVSNGTASGLTLSGTTEYTFDVTPSTSSGSLTVSIGTGTFTDETGNSNIASSNTLSYTVDIPDTTAPDLTVSSHTDNETITGSTVTLTGTVTDTGGVASVTVNGLSATLGTGTWSRTLTGLSAGTNTFTIIPTDTTGNTGSTTWNIVRLSIPSSVSATLSGSTEAVIAFATDITATGVVLYGTASGSLTTSATGSAGTSHAINLLGLTEDTTYYYQVYGVSGGQNGDSSSIMSFKTPVVIDITTSSGTVTATGSVYLSGTTSTGVTFTNTGSLEIVSTTDTGASVTLSLSGLTISASGTWDGVFQAPEVVAETATGVDIGYSFTGNVYQIGSPNTELILSGSTASVTVNIGASLSGQTLRIYRSTDGGATYAYLTTCTVDASGNCTFTSDQFSLFALAGPSDSTPDAFSFTDVSSAELSTVYESNTVTITGMTAPANISITGGQYALNGGSYTSATGTVSAGDTVKVKVTSSASYTTAVNAVLTIDTLSDTYTVTTKATPASGGGGGGGSVSKDTCPQGDYSASYYDGICGTAGALS